MKLTESQKEYLKEALAPIDQKYDLIAEEEQLLGYVFTLLSSDEEGEALKRSCLENLRELFDEDSDKLPVFVDDLFHHLEQSTKPQKVEVPIYRYSSRRGGDSESEDDDDDERPRRYQKERSTGDRDPKDSRDSRDRRMPEKERPRDREEIREAERERDRKNFPERQRERDRDRDRDLERDRRIPSEGRKAPTTLPTPRELAAAAAAGVGGIPVPLAVFPPGMVRRTPPFIPVIPRVPSLPTSSEFEVPLTGIPAALPLPRRIDPPAPRPTIERLRPFETKSQGQQPFQVAMKPMQQKNQDFGSSSSEMGQPQSQNFAGPTYQKERKAESASHQDNYQVPMTDMRSLQPGGEGTQPFHSKPKPPKSSIVQVDKIPVEYLTIAQLNDHFKKFGPIVHIQIVSEKRQALIEFSTPYEAYAAYKSPDPIFDNRFITLSLYREEKDRSHSYHPGKGEVKEPSGPSQAQLEEQKRQELLQKNLELQKQKNAMIERFTEEQKKIFEKLKSPDVSEEEKKELRSRVNSLSQQIVMLKGSSISKTGVSMTLVNKKPDTDPSAKRSPSPPTEGSETSPGVKRPFDATKTSPHTSPPSMRGGIGRGGFIPGGIGRGAPTWAGRGGYTGPSNRIDNRPTRFQVKKVPEAHRSEEALREHFSKFGEVVQITLQPDDSAIIQYTTRPFAEAGFLNGQKINGEQMAFLWLANPPASTPSPTLPSAPFAPPGQPQPPQAQAQNGSQAPQNGALIEKEEDKDKDKDKDKEKEVKGEQVAPAQKSLEERERELEAELMNDKDLDHLALESDDILDDPSIEAILLEELEEEEHQRKRQKL